MLKVGQLIRFVAGLNPQNTPAKLSFYNFLRGFPHPDDALTPELIELFFIYCMDYPHWAANKNQLSNEVQYLLENFNTFYQQNFDLSKIRFPQTMQLLEIERPTDLEDVLMIFLKRQYSEADKIRIINDQNKRMVALVLHEDRSLTVRIFDKKFTIRDGHLEPLRKDLALYYTAGLELSPDHKQKIEVAPYIVAEFRVKNDKVHGALLRGYVYQKLLEFKGESLKEQTRLLYPIKRLEQFFIDRRTDPYYQDLISQLERTLALIQQGDPEALNWSTMIINQAETALENVFTGDKLLTLLVRDLRHTSESTRKLNPSLKMGKSLNEADEECLKITPRTNYDLTN
ncbi:hypothetical protein [Bdellovibrio sp. HCB337]|uniref:hypothetical protein n=1 Tax=Bdellovibrio sp. HCB337 TaxID=3394358 RepID=UPI0039A6DB5B